MRNVKRLTTKVIGDRGERIAARYLKEKGYRVMDRNYRYRRAELDLVCFEPEGEAGGEIVFVEVKSRQGLEHGRPEEAVHWKKRRQIEKAARAYLYERKMEGSSCRFDVVSIHAGAGEPQVRHYERAFMAGE